MYMFIEQNTIVYRRRERTPTENGKWRIDIKTAYTEACINNVDQQQERQKEKKIKIDNR